MTNSLFRFTLFNKNLFKVINSSIGHSTYPPSKVSTFNNTNFGKRSIPWSWVAGGISGLMFGGGSAYLYFQHEKKCQFKLDNGNLQNLGIKELKDFKKTRVDPDRSSRKFKLKQEHPSGNQYYLCQRLSIQQLNNEFIVSELVKILELNYPEAYPIELTKCYNGKTEIGLLRQNYALDHMPLDQWICRYYGDHELELVRPHNLGMAIALNLLLGKDNLKPSDIIEFSPGLKPCYSVNHDNLFAKEPQFIANAEAALNSLLGSNRSKEENFATNILLKAIQDDVAKGNIEEFYLKFAKLTDKTIHELVDKYRWAQTPALNAHLKKQLFAIREACINHCLDQPKRITMGVNK